MSGNRTINILFEIMHHCLQIFSSTAVRPSNTAVKENLKGFGQYIAECLPKYVQKVQLAHGDELEVLICPEGVIPVLSFLKDHHQAEFVNLIDIAGVDVPSRQYRFEVIWS